MTLPDHFARIRPVVGEALAGQRVALSGFPTAVPLVHYLAASGIGRWCWVGAGEREARALRRHLLDSHGEALGLALPRPLPERWEAMREDCALVMAVGAAREGPPALRAARVLGVPALIVRPPSRGLPCRLLVWLPGDPLPSLPMEAPDEVLDHRAWATSAPLCAALARALLLRDTPYRRADLEEIWAAGGRWFRLGEGGDPFRVTITPSVDREPDREAERLPFHTPPAGGARVLVAGLGSLGSVAAMHLPGQVAGVVLVDPDRVDPYNPVRQAYSLSSVGRWKVEALGERLRRAALPVIARVPRPLDEAGVIELVRRHKITAALVTTGTEADFTLARGLRAAGIPHVVGRCYPRARYWEAMVVDGRAGPAFDELRGHLLPGPLPPPTPEQRAAYSGAGPLEAEPATLVESGWAAAWLSRLLIQLAVPPGLRERWFLGRLAAGQHCFIGGIEVIRTATGPAYGVARPGEIHGWRLEQIGGR